MANLTRALVIEPTFAEAEKLYDAMDGEHSREAQLIRSYLFRAIDSCDGADPESLAPISITVTLREQG